MKNIGGFAAVLGIGLAAALYAHEGFETIAALLRASGYGLILASLFHGLPMLMNARAWQALMPPSRPLRFGPIAVATWIRESVNGVLPVARIGGEIAAYRLLTRRDAACDAVAASLVADVVLSMSSQGAFALIGLVLAIEQGLATTLSRQLGVAFVVLVGFASALVAIQRSTLSRRLVHAAGRTLSARWSGPLGRSLQIDEAIRRVYADPTKIVVAFAWQLGGWIVGAGEVWIASCVLGVPLSLPDALLIEAFVQTIASVAFIVPGAYGVQEAAFWLIGTLVGIDGPASLALAAARRLRDLLVFVPGLCAWSIAEFRGRAGSATPATEASPGPPPRVARVRRGE